MLRLHPRSTGIFLLFAALSVHAQQNDIPLNRDIYYDIDRNGACRTSTMHTGLKPIIESRADLDNVMGFRYDNSRQYYPITELLFKKHVIDVREKGFHLTADPVLDLEYGKDFVDPHTSVKRLSLENVNSRGFWVKADFGNKVSFQSSFYENQAQLPSYLYLYAQSTGVVPGQGRIKEFNKTGLDYAWAMGNVSYTPARWLNVQVGNGRHFVGNGYRSVLLSDNAFPYPFVKLSAITNNGRFQYTTINAKLQMVSDPADRLPTGTSSESLFFWKRASFRHLSVNLGPAQLGLFEATIWRNIDSAGVRSFNAMELNPVIGLNTIINGFGKDNKQLVGADLKYRITDKVFVYGQYALDDPAKNRYAWQAGMQWFDLFRRDLHLLLEYNTATPFAYTSSIPRGSYSQYDQPLANPLGAGYDETVAIVDYGIKQRFWLRAVASIANTRVDTSAAAISGGDIFMTGARTGADSLTVHRQRVWLDLSFTWRMNQMQNTSLSIGFSNRDLSSAPGQLDSHYIYIAFRTGLFNRYYDL